MHSLYMGVRDLRANLVHEVAATARTAASSPDLAVDSTMPRSLQALNEALAHYESLVVTTVQPGHEQWAERNLPDEEKADLANARHFLKILNMLYPQVQIAEPSPVRTP
jgi:hypothetical protein